MKLQMSKKSGITVIGSSLAANKFCYSNTGRMLAEGQKPVGAIERTGDGYGLIVWNKKYSQVWEDFLKSIRQECADDLAGKFDEEKAGRKVPGADDNTLSAAYLFHEQIAHAIVDCVDNGRFHMVEPEELKAIFEELPVTHTDPVDEDKSYINKGPVNLQTAFKTYAMWSKTRTEKAESKKKAKKGSKKASAKPSEPAPWRDIENPEEGQSYLAGRYGEIYATMKSKETTIAGMKRDFAREDFATNLPEGVIVLAEKKDGSGEERISGEYLRFLRATNVIKAGPRFMASFEVFIDEAAIDAYNEAKKVIDAETRRRELRKSEKEILAKFDEDRQELAAKIAELQAELEAKIEADAEVKAARDLLKVADDKLTTFKAEWNKKYGQKTEVVMIEAEAPAAE